MLRTFLTIFYHPPVSQKYIFPTPPNMTYIIVELQANNQSLFTPGTGKGAVRESPRQQLLLTDTLILLSSLFCLIPSVGTASYMPLTSSLVL